LCVAVLVPSTDRPSNLGLAVQAPIMRMTPEKALTYIPKLQRAAKALQAIEEQAASGPDAAS
jgi:DNA-binding IclR family transcriptional regulator